LTICCWFLGLCGLCALGYYSIGLHAEGLAARRANEFVAVAEQIRLDVKNKLDAFIQAEQDRPYTDYQYFYVPVARNDAAALIRSPLAESMEHGLAYGYFQIDSAGTIESPYNPPGEVPVDTQARLYIDNIKKNVLTALRGDGWTTSSTPAQLVAGAQREAKKQDSHTANEKLKDNIEGWQYDDYATEAASKKTAPRSRQAYDGGRRGQYRIPSLDESRQTTQVYTRDRYNVQMNIDNSAIRGYGVMMQQRGGIDAPQRSAAAEVHGRPGMGSGGMVAGYEQRQRRLDRVRSQPQSAVEPSSRSQADRTRQQAAQVEDVVQIRVEPFAPIVVAGADEDSRFGGQVFLLRHVQIEQRHLLQGFKLNESELVRQVAESARIGVLRRDMGFDVGCVEAPEAVHTAILDFGFGELVLNLFELKPGLIAGQVSNLKKGFFAIVGLVFVAVMLAQVSLWRSVREQVRLARKKDDFISAVSHELRTPLTTIRMYTEMLEKGWIRNESRRSEYYATMRQESERLSRLIENVLDFSRIQRGRKKYNFRTGDVNACISDVIDMMTPCAIQAGFSVEKDFEQVPQFAFDADAVMQIVINLMDNAVKYARGTAEKLICVRTRCRDGYVLIEVEDHGPGVPKPQRQKVFDEFYRCGDESRRETTGTGLGLALVKRFAQAHNGFVDILTAKPAGAIFRVGLAVRRA